MSSARLSNAAHGRILPRELAKVCEQLEMTEETARRLRKIAEAARLTNPDHGRLLPRSWRSLYELTKLSDAEFEAGVAARIITPARIEKLIRDDVEALSLWTEATKRPGGQRTDLVNNVHEVTPERPQGNSREAALRRLNKAASGGS